MLPDSVSRWSRRRFLKALGLGAAGFALRACNALNPENAPRATSSTPPVKPTATITPYPTLDPFHVDLQVSTESLTSGRFLGFGAEWDSRSYLNLGVSEADYQVIFQRIRWMQLPIIRMMILLKWYCAGPKAYHFNSPEMKVVYRHLDFCQNEGISVILTDWGCEPDWLRVNGIENVADPQYAEAIGRCLDHLIHKKNYTCIQYFIFGNEPDYEVKDWNRWKFGVENVSAVMKDRGLADQIGLIGPDIGGDLQWLEKTAADLSGFLSGYDIHCYAIGTKLRQGQLEETLKSNWDIVTQNDPLAKQKPRMITEAGLWDGSQPPYGNPTVENYIYGVVMADYAIQAVHSGASTVIAWMLDDNSHEGFFSGLWKNRNENLQLRPWFFTWSLLCRLFPPDCSFLQCPKVDQNVRMLAAKTPSGDWSICIANREDAPANINLSIPVERNSNFQVYEYCEWSTVRDENGFPIPVKTFEIAPDQTFSIMCQANSVLFLTSS